MINKSCWWSSNVQYYNMELEVYLIRVGDHQFQPCNFWGWGHFPQDLIQRDLKVCQILVGNHPFQPLTVFSGPREGLNWAKFSQNLIISKASPGSCMHQLWNESLVFWIMVGNPRGTYTGMFSIPYWSQTAQKLIWSLQGHGLLRHFHVKVHVSLQRFSNLASDWLAVQPMANQKPL